MRAKLFFGLMSISFVLFIYSCKNQDDTIIGKWQNVLIIGQSPQGVDTIDVSQFPITYNTFREDSSLYITNGEKEVNVRYFIKDNQLFSFQMGAFDTSIMDIKKLTKDELILQVNFKDDDLKKDKLYYKRVK